MPSNCLLANASPYAVRHNPAECYTNIRTAGASRDGPPTTEQLLGLGYLGNAATAVSMRRAFHLRASRGLGRPCRGAPHPAIGVSGRAPPPSR
jgi:hypothetical protein